MYIAIHNPMKPGWEVSDTEGNWVAGPWSKREIAVDFAAAMNLEAKMRLAESEHRQESTEANHA